MNMEKYWEWLCSIPGVYRTQIEVLIRLFHNPEAVWRASEKELDFLETRGIRWIERIKKAKNSLLPDEIVDTHRQGKIQFISREHENFPGKLLPLPDCPWGLFYRGSLPKPDSKAVAIVGARQCTRQGKEYAELLAAAVARAEGIVISGVAYGIDGASQWAALKQKGESYGLLGCGVDVIYPASHRRLYEWLERQGGLISEYPPGTQPQRYHFPQRNRLISGLSDIVIVVEAREKSGSLLTAGFAAEQGRSVWAVPGRTDDELSRGCNELIHQGANLLLSVDSFMKTEFPEKHSQRKYSGEIVLAPAEKLVYSSLDLHAKTLWEIEESTLLSVGELSESLIALEQKGLICEAGQRRYRRCP